jgi:hypothetical protein
MQLKMLEMNNGRASVACVEQETRKLSTGRSREEKLKRPPVTLAFPHARPLLPERVRMTRYNQRVQLPDRTALVPRSNV